MKLLVMLFAFLLVGNYLLANDTIIVRKDPRLDVLVSKQAQMNKRLSMMTSSGLYKGYRIQIVSTTNRDQANKIKADILSKYTDEKAYLLYHSPYFKVRIGNFLKKEDAEKFRKELNKTYPQGVYVVEDAIEYSMKDDDEVVPK
ncbi:SPOR domain-containing protein [Parasediminibacterium sp. JCM 36343]|uniref:SPOR domain-containing protein n=1 Tax=Parasediminibacterium sp. JCM 36343 TaxID=3374279 RepID=UPI00397BA52E